MTGSVIDMSDKSGDAFIARFQNNEIPLFNYIFDNPKMDGNLSGRNNNAAQNSLNAGLLPCTLFGMQVIHF